MKKRKKYECIRHKLFTFFIVMLDQGTLAKGKGLYRKSPLRKMLDKKLSLDKLKLTGQNLG